MSLTRSVLVTTPALKSEEVDSVWQQHPFKLQLGNVSYRLTYSELNKILSDAEGEIRDYLGEEHV